MHTGAAHAESLGPGGVVWELLHCYIVIDHLREPACANRLVPSGWATRGKHLMSVPLLEHPCLCAAFAWPSTATCCLQDNRRRPGLLQGQPRYRRSPGLPPPVQPHHILKLATLAWCRRRATDPCGGSGSGSGSGWGRVSGRWVTELQHKLCAQYCLTGSHQWLPLPSCCGQVHWTCQRRPRGWLCCACAKRANSWHERASSHS